MDETRALLDALMGPNRNQKAATCSGEPEFVDSSVCKHFLVGFCPHDWFTTGSRTLKPCTKIHSETMRDRFQSHPDVSAYRAEWEEDFLNYLESVARECDVYIARGRAKCRSAGGQVVRLPPELKDKCHEMETRYAELIQASEELADESVTKRHEQMSQAAALKAELDALKLKYTSDFAGEDICEVCGVKYAANDKEWHYRGKTHEGYDKIRRKITELRSKEKRKEWEKERESIKALREKRKGWEREKEREREKKEREKEKERKEREREKEKEKAEKEKERQKREKEKERERERERETEREREREREREKSRERSREQARAKEKAEAEKQLQKDQKKHKDGGRERGRGRDRDSSKGRVARAEDESSDRSRSRLRRRSKSSDGRDGEAYNSPSQDDMDMPALWERLQKLPPADRPGAMGALEPEVMDRLEVWLVARVAAKKAAASASVS